MSRLTKRTPLVAVPACELAQGQTIVTRSGRVLELDRITRRSNEVHLFLGSANAVIPAHAPVMAYVSA